MNNVDDELEDDREAELLAERERAAARLAAHVPPAEIEQHLQKRLQLELGRGFLHIVPQRPRPRPKR